MLFKILAGLSIFSTICFADPGKPPEFWCRAEPIENTSTKDYLKFDPILEKACSDSLQACEMDYTICEITGCGQWFLEVECE